MGLGDSIDTTLAAGENLNTDGHQFHAIDFSDGKLAANGSQACGIIINKPKSGEAARVAFFGELRYAAGGAIAANKAITVTASGWFTAAGSGDYIIGRTKEAVTSGSIGKGIFDFSKPVYAFNSSYAW